MSLRLIEVFLPNIAQKSVQAALKDRRLLGIWRDQLSEHQVTFKLLLPAEETEEVLDLLEKKFSNEEGFRILILPVEATIPRPESPEEREKTRLEEERERERKKKERDKTRLEEEIEKERKEKEIAGENKKEKLREIAEKVAGEGEKGEIPLGTPLDETPTERDAGEQEREQGKEGVFVLSKLGLGKLDLKSGRVAREELYAEIEDSIQFSWVYMAMIVLSTIVAAVGILRDNVAVIIGAMVIAPLLGPNVALSLATTLGDTDLARRALKANLVGIALGLSMTILLGLIISVFYGGIDTDATEIATRTEVNLGDIVLALAAGSAAALSFTRQTMSALIGVMVAVALLPPLVVLGMLIGSGEWSLAGGAFMLLLINIIGINLSGVVVFLAQGIRPLRWWEADRAKKATRIAIVLWSFLLLVLIIIILLSKPTT